MKKLIKLIISIILATVCIACSFQPKQIQNEPPLDTERLITDELSIRNAFEKVYNEEVLVDSENGFDSLEDISGARFFVDGEYRDSFEKINAGNDVRFEFYNSTNARIVDASCGMAYTVPSDGRLTADYSIAAYRTQLIISDSILTASAENSNPYGNTASSWKTYRDEWLLRWLQAEDFYIKNSLQLLNESVYENTSLRAGFEIYMYSVRIRDTAGIVERPYYNIGVIRKQKDYINFGFFVMKSKKDKSVEMQNILFSYQPLEIKATEKNYYSAGEPLAEPAWNQETKDYYSAILASDKVNWGFFSYSMTGQENSLVSGSGEYDNNFNNSRLMREGIEEKTDYKFDIYPTYTHLRWSGKNQYFPLAMASSLAGGNGKNGKAVLQFTYQFTTDNNNAGNNYTPMFDVLRGVYDEHFKRLARDIKAYAKPILFRLNNEMNSDWVSYSGMMTLCDPDIFRLTWKRLYNIFIQEGVDNCIWIWNPMGKCYPFASWNENLCYNPGEQFIQLLGLSEYEMNNGAQAESFRDMYSKLYGANQAFNKYRAIISEFACGSGGDYSGRIGRNAARQAKWVKEMFECFSASDSSDFINQIIGAVWFNCNDYSGEKITNRLRIFEPESIAYADLDSTLSEFKKGLAIQKK